MTQGSIDIPRPEAVTPEWLARQLGNGVAIQTLTIEPVGTGQLGDTVRFSIGYASGSAPGPATLIGKFAAADPDSRDIAKAWRLYEREVGFYRRLAGHAGIAIPTCHGTAFDPATNHFALLLEDCAPFRPGDQFAGITRDQALRVVREAARLHGAFWDRGDDSALQWLDTGPLAQPFYDATVLRGAWPAFRDRYVDRLTDAMMTVCDRLAERYERYSAPLDRRRCVTHNDYRPDNILFADDGDVRVIDWQSAALGYNAVDIAYMIGGAFTPEERRGIESELLDVYLRELTGLGVSDYERDELDADYRHFSFAGINVAVGAAMMVKRTERGDRMFLTMLDRHVAHVLDTGALDILS